MAVGGYGEFYVKALLEEGAKHGARIAGVVDPFADTCGQIDELKRLGVPICNTLDEFYAQHNADLAVISSPIHFHCTHTCRALKAGTNVLCEKPLGATVQEADRMIEESGRTGRFVDIGYQWSHSEAIQRFKADVMAGDFGSPVRLKTIVLWTRNETYYNRNSWAGAKMSADGSWILDSPVNNATAHYLHNMFYVLGEQIDRAARPLSVTAELYRANPITNYDTGVVRCRTNTGVEILYYAAHPVATSRGPDFVYEFEQATVRIAGREELGVEFKDGKTRNYGSPHTDGRRKLWHCIDAVRTRGSVLCPPEAARSQTLCMNGMHESMPEITEFPRGLIGVKDGVTFVDGLSEVLSESYSRNALPSELDVAWARKGREVDLANYTRFPATDN